MPRQSPKDSATLFDVGKRKKGNDGNMWIVVLDKNNRKRWTKTKNTKQPTSKVTSINNSPNVNTFKKIKSGTTHKLHFCEPVTFGDRLKSSKYSIFLEIKDVSLFKKIPIYLKNSRGNAYVFGKSFPVNQYYFVGYIGNDAAQVGIIDTTNATIEDLKTIPANSKWNEIFAPKLKSRKNIYKWDDEANLKLVKKMISPRILFVGETYGDVGADVLIHYKSNDQLPCTDLVKARKSHDIDSIIIDSYYFKSHG